MARAPPVHSVTFWPVISRWMPPAWVPSARWTAKKSFDLRAGCVERPGLVAVAAVIVLPCIGSHDQTTGRALALHRADQLRQMVADLVGAEAADQRQPARLVVRVEDVDQAEQLVGLERRAAFEADRILDAAADTRHARGRAGGCGRRSRACGRRCAYQSPRGGIDAGQRLLVAEQQRLVAGVEVGRAQLRMRFRIDAAGAHEVAASR